jgi:hypothetical protein
MTWSAKSPTDVADYWIDWSSFLSSDESITSISITADTGLTVVNSSFTDKVVRVRLAGGDAGSTYSIGCTITTTNTESFFVNNALIIQERVANW